MRAVRHTLPGELASFSSALSVHNETLTIGHDVSSPKGETVVMLFEEILEVAPEWIDENEHMNVTRYLEVISKAD